MQRVLEDAFKTQKLFSSIFFVNLGVVPNSSTPGKLNQIKHTSIYSITMHVYRPVAITIIPSLKEDHMRLTTQPRKGWPRHRALRPQ